jgi:hypothetical protein
MLCIFFDTAKIILFTDYDVNIKKILGLVLNSKLKGILCLKD